MSEVWVMFKKSFVIPKQDYEIFRNENYECDDGTTHLFYKDDNYLFVLDTDGKPYIGINFYEMKLENKQCYEIGQIYYKLKKNIDPKNNFSEAEKVVWDIVVEVLTLLKDIISKRTKDIDTKNEIFEYNFYDKDAHMYDKIFVRNQRINYLQALSKI